MCVKSSAPVHSSTMKGGSNGINTLDEVERKELWKTISECEKQAVELLISGQQGSGNEDVQQIEEAFKLLSQSAGLKNSDPFLQLATQYAAALKRKDVVECESILKSMRVIGVPPHIASLASKQLAARHLEIKNSALYQFDEVDLGSTFSEAVTEKIRVKVSSFYDGAHSDPVAGQYRFSYKVAIFNEGAEPVQLVGRTWEVVKCTGEKETMRGPGVTKTQPIISPGDVFNYESSCPLKVFPPRGKRVIGSMTGAFTMCKGNIGQHQFLAKVSKFNFIVPESVAVGI